LRFLLFPLCLYLLLVLSGGRVNDHESSKQLTRLLHGPPPLSLSQLCFFLSHECTFSFSSPLSYRGREIVTDTRVLITAFYLFFPTFFPFLAPFFFSMATSVCRRYVRRAYEGNQPAQEKPWRRHPFSGASRGPTASPPAFILHRSTTGEVNYRRAICVVVLRFFFPFFPDHRDASTD